MIQKLIAKGVNSNLIIWIHKFLTSRIQYVRFKSAISSPITINTGAPQGCVLSASLFTIYTSDKECSCEQCKIIKYADDTVIIGLLSDRDETNDNCYLDEVSKFSDWCKDNYLDLNVKKTKEMIIDFRVKKEEMKPVLINSQPVDVVENYKYLGTIIDNKLSGCDNAQRIYKKANQRLYFVRKLNHVNVSKTIMTLFYKSVVESVICFCIICWFGGCTEVEKKKLSRIIRHANRLGCSVESLQDIYDKALSKQLCHILKDNTHPLYHCFNFLPA